MTRILLAAAATIAVLGCSDSTRPTNYLAGTDFDFTGVNGLGPPVSIGDNGDCSQVVQTGDLAFAASTAMLTIGYRPNGCIPTVTATFTADAAYRTRADTIFLDYFSGDLSRSYTDTALVTTAGLTVHTRALISKTQPSYVMTFEKAVGR